MSDVVYRNHTNTLSLQLLTHLHCSHSYRQQLRVVIGQTDETVSDKLPPAPRTHVQVQEQDGVHHGCLVGAQ